MPATSRPQVGVPVWGVQGLRRRGRGRGPLLQIGGRRVSRAAARGRGHGPLLRATGHVGTLGVAVTRQSAG